MITFRELIEETMMPVDKICLVSNRNVLDSTFGEGTNALGIGEVRVATVRMDDEGAITVNILPESDDDEVLPSHSLFSEYLDELRRESQNVVLYVHGFNTSFEKSVREAWDIHRTYGTGVVLFSWPSNPGGFVLREYKKARRAAEASSPAFDNTLEKLAGYHHREVENALRTGLDCELTFNLICFSQGNYLLQRFVESSYYEGETRLFANAILMQADVDSEGHEQWATAAGRHRVFRRLYVTINESDWVLRKSEKINPDRLGSTLDNLVGPRVRYVDFTDAPELGRSHGFFKSDLDGNTPGSQVRSFFKSALNGRIPERELQLAQDIQTGAWRVAD